MKIDFTENNTSFSDAKFCVIPAPLDKSSSFQKGSDKGPQSLLEASQEIELFDCKTKKDFSSAGIYTFKLPDYSKMSASEALEDIKSKVEQSLESEKWPICIGGEHTISLAPISSLYKKNKKPFSVLQIDAHADLRDSYQGNKLSHASIMKRVFDLGIQHVGVGIRNYCEEEWKLIQKENIKIYHAHDYKNDYPIEKIINDLNETDIYLTIDADGLDPSLVPATGTPEPGGLNWWTLSSLLDLLFQSKNVIGMDVNEIKPIQGTKHSEFILARLIYECIGRKNFKQV